MYVSIFEEPAYNYKMSVEEMEIYFPDACIVFSLNFFTIFTLHLQALGSLMFKFQFYEIILFFTIFTFKKLYSLKFP